MKNPYLPKPVKVIGIKNESADNFTLRLNMQIRYEPGQFLQVSLPGIGEAPFSFASYSNKYVELDIHQVGNVTNALANLKKGNTVLVRGPYGKGYPMQDFKEKGIVIIGGGCGVAPLKGAIEYIEKNRKDFKEVILFLGFRAPKDILFKYKIPEWKKRFNLNISVDENPSRTCFDGRVGFVTKLLEESKLDGKNKIALICGPPIMMRFAIKTLKDKGFKDEQIYVSAERLMYCGIGICGHCMIHGKYTCKDGPVFRYDEIQEYEND